MKSFFDILVDRLNSLDWCGEIEASYEDKEITIVGSYEDLQEGWNYFKQDIRTLKEEAGLDNRFDDNETPDFSGEYIIYVKVPNIFFDD